MVETNIRDATLVGILTGTGIGFVFNVYYKSFDYGVTALILLFIIVVVIACEATSNYVRRQNHMSLSISATASAERVAEAKLLDDSTLGIKRSHGGRIKTRLANKSNTVLWITLGALAAVTVFTFVIMDYGKIPMAEAVPAALEDFATMLTQPWLVNHFTMEDVIVGTATVAWHWLLLTTFIGAVIAFFFGLFAAMNLSNKCSVKRD